MPRPPQGIPFGFHAKEQSREAEVGRRVWEGARDDREPDETAMRDLARSVDADVVFMALVDCGHRLGANGSRFPDKFWALDLETGETLVHEGRPSHIRAGAEALFGAVAGRHGGRAAGS